MSSQKVTVHLDPDVVDTELGGGETALLHLGTKTYFSLNATGARIWRYLRQGLDPDAVAAKLHAEFDVDATHAKDSVAALIDELAKNQLIRIA